MSVGARADRDRLVLLGTKGGPAVRAFSPSPTAHVLVYRGVPYVVDAGYGVTFKLVEAGVALPALRHVFITHHHSDHDLELGALLYNAWAIGLSTPVDVHGPAGTVAMLAAYWESMAFDIVTRVQDEGRPDLRALVRPHDFAEGPVFSDAQVTVTALRNVHPPVTESYALRFAFPDRAVVFSGDTAYFPPLAAFAKGADVLVHEVMYGPALEALVRRNPNASTLMAHLRASHTLAEDVGRIATEAGVGTLVLDHFVPADDRTLTERHWADAVRATYRGPLVVGRDLLEVPL